MLETRNLLIAGRSGLAGGYLLGSLVAGTIGVWLGVALTRLAIALARRHALHGRGEPARPVVEVAWGDAVTSGDRSGDAS